MATLFYSVAGEGLGHATRAKGVIDALSKKHRVIVFSFHQGYEFLREIYAETDVEVIEIPGLKLCYTRSGKLHYWLTFFYPPVYWYKAIEYQGALKALFKRYQPDLVIADFDKLLPNAARRYGVTCMTLDHPSFLLKCELSSLPWSLRMHLYYLRPIVAGFFQPKVDHAIISSYFKLPLRKKYRDTQSVGIILREEIRHANITDEGHLTVYLRGTIAENVIDTLKGYQGDVHLFGNLEPHVEANVHFHPIETENFTRKVLSARGVIATAGNQIVGEMLWLQKPLLMLPETNNNEQKINAAFASHYAGVMTGEMENFNAQLLAEFLAMPKSAPLSEEEKAWLDGLPAVLESVDELINQAA